MESSASCPVFTSLSIILDLTEKVTICIVGPAGPSDYAVVYLSQ